MQAGPGRQHCTHLVEQGAAEPKNTLFHTELEIWSVACWGDSHGAGCGTPVPGGWDGLGLGWLRGRGRARAPSLPHSSREQLWQLCPLTPGRGGSAGAASPAQPSLPAQPRAGQGARLEAQAGLQREQDPSSSPLLAAAWHKRPGTEQQPFPTARQGIRDTHRTGWAGHPPVATNSWGRNGSAQHGVASPPPAASAGTPQV